MNITSGTLAAVSIPVENINKFRLTVDMYQVDYEQRRAERLLLIGLDITKHQSNNRKKKCRQEPSVFS